MIPAVVERPVMLPASKSFPSPDLELSLDAARAAAQIDQLMRGEKPSEDNGQPVVDAIEAFVRLLENLGLERLEPVGQKSFMDPASSRIFAMASEQAKLATKISSYRELGDVLLRVLNLLGRARKQSQLKPSELEQLRSFFIYLSDFAAAERRAVVSRPKQPYRR